MILEMADAPVLSEALDQLEAAAQASNEQPVILTRHERPVGVFLPLRGVTQRSWPVDREMLAVSLREEFAAMVQRGREAYQRGETASLEDIRRKYGITDEAATSGRGRRTQSVPGDVEHR